jgi:hypothetical protein
MKVINFKDSDFSKMMFPIHKYGDHIDLLECKEFSRLKDYGDLFTNPIKNISLERVLRYIFLMYDINSPLHSISILDQARRKVTAAKLAYFKPEKDTGHFQKELLEIMIGQNERVNRMVVRFSLMFYVPKYTKLIAYMAAYEKQMTILLDGDQDQHTLKIVQGLEDEMENIITQIFSGDNSMSNARTLYRIIDEEQLELSPELIVERISEGKNAIEIDPYNYKDYIQVS